jgi:hypothetical protein
MCSKVLARLTDCLVIKKSASNTKVFIRVVGLFESTKVNKKSTTNGKVLVRVTNKVSTRLYQGFIKGIPRF